MEYTLKDFAGRYSCLPDAVRYITSPDGYLVFSEIYSYGCRTYGTTLVTNYISISRRNLQKATGLGRIRIENATKELADLGILLMFGDAREKRSYSINWDEIYYVNKVLSSLSYDGIYEVRIACRISESVIPVSRIESTQIENIKASFKYEFEQSGLISDKSAKINPDCNGENYKSGLILNSSNEINPDESEASQSGLILNKNAEINPVSHSLTHESGLISDKSAKINPDCKFIWVEKQHKITEEENGDLILNVFLDEAETILAKRIGISKINLGCFSQSGLISDKIWVDFEQKRQKSVENQPRVNIYKYKKNELTERSEVSNIGVEKEEEVEKAEKVEKIERFEGLENFEEAEEDKRQEEVEEVEKAEEEEAVFEGLEKIELVEVISPDEYYRRGREKYKHLSKANNPYRNKPYFSEDAVKRITATTGLLEEGYKSPVKLFYFNLWGGLYDWYLEETEENLPVDEYGEPLSDEAPSDLDMLGFIISERRMADIVCHAWDETRDQAEAGFIELEHEKVELEFRELPENFHPEYLVDWRKAETEGKVPGFVVSLDGFRNIEAEDVTEVKHPRSKEDKAAFNRKNRQFIAAVMQMDESQLTPIEKAVRDFAQKFISFDEYYHVTGFMNGRGLPMMCRDLPGFLITPWSITLRDFGVKREEFFAILNIPGGYKDGSNLRRMNTTFVYEEVKRWNEMKGFQSKINEESLHTFVLSDDF